MASASPRAMRNRLLTEELVDRLPFRGHYQRTMNVLSLQEIPFPQYRPEPSHSSWGLKWFLQSVLLYRAALVADILGNLWRQTAPGEL